MRSFLGIVRTCVRILLGAFLLCVGIAFILSTVKNLHTDLPPNASGAYISGWIIGGTLFPLIIAAVGFKMMTRRSLPH